MSRMHTAYAFCVSPVPWAAAHDAGGGTDAASLLAESRTQCKSARAAHGAGLDAAAALKRERRGQKVNQRRFLCQCNRTTAQIGCCDHRTTLLAVDSDAFDSGIL